MNLRRGTIVLAVVLALFVVSFCTVSAESARPECNESDPNGVCKGNITVFVFVDRVRRGESNLLFNDGADSPLPGARVTLIMPDGSRVQRITGSTGRLNYPAVDLLPEEEAFFEIEFPAHYRDAVLIPCRNSSIRRSITSESFGSLRSTLVVFCARQRVPSPTPSEGN